MPPALAWLIFQGIGGKKVKKNSVFFENGIDFLKSR